MAAWDASMLSAAAMAAGPASAPHYEHLGVGPEASAEEIRSAYRRAALATHPDKGGDSQAFVRVVRAFEVLSDPESRRRYDRSWLCGPAFPEEPPDPQEPPGRPRRRKRRAGDAEPEPAPAPGPSGAGPGGRTPGEAARAAVLDRLFGALRDAAAQGERRELLALLGAPLRAALLSRFERHPAQPAAAPRPSAPELSSSDSESEDAAVAGRVRLALADGPSECGQEDGSSRGSLKVRGVCRRSLRANSPAYQASIAPARGFHVRSSLQLTLDAAIEQHIVLMGAKKEVSGLEGSLEERLRSAFSRLAPPGTKYYCQVHAQGLIGRKLYSPETPDINIALSAWRRLYDALSQGWAALRETWIAVQLEMSGSTNPGRPSCKYFGINFLRANRSRSDLEAVLKSYEEDDVERRERFQAREARRAERLQEREAEEELRRDRARVRRAQHVVALARRYDALLWQERRGEDRRLEDLHRARLQWHRRQDLTMEEILRGPPA